MGGVLMPDWAIVAIMAVVLLILVLVARALIPLATHGSGVGMRVNTASKVVAIIGLALCGYGALLAFLRIVELAR
jgi:hypothetical protein